MFGKVNDEISLIERWRKGDDKAFDRLYRIHVARLQQFAFRHTNDMFIAEELVMDVMLKVWHRRDVLDEKATSLGPFLFHLLKASLVDHYRRRKTEHVPLDAVAENTESGLRSDSPTLVGELNQLYEQGIHSLTPMQQKVYRMRHEEAQSYQQISQNLRIAVKTVDRHLHSAKTSLRAYMSRYIDMTLLIVACFLSV